MFSLFSKKTATFGLFLKEDEMVGFMIGRDKHGKARILADAVCSYANGLDSIVEDGKDLLNALEQKTGLKSQEAIFFLYSHFFDNETTRVHEKYRDAIHKLCFSLSLNIFGYIEVAEAVSAHLDLVEQKPVSAVFVELDSKTVSVIVYRENKKESVHSATRTDSICKDILEAVGKPQEPLPLKILFYDEEHLRGADMEIIGNVWEPEYFAEHPEVEKLEDNSLYQCLADTFAEVYDGSTVAMPPLAPESHIEEQPAESEILEPDADEYKDITPQEETQVEQSMEESEPELESENWETETPQEEVVPPVEEIEEPMDFTETERKSEPTSFTDSDEPLLPREDKVYKEPKDVPAEVLGFVIGGEYKIPTSPLEEELKPNAGGSKTFRTRRGNPFAGLIGSFFGVFSSLPRVLPSLSGLTVVILFVCIVAGAAIAEIFLHSATLTVQVPTQKIAKELHVLGRIDSQLDGTLAVRLSTASVELKETAPATGRREEGEKSHGEVTIYSFDDKEKVFAKGTQLSSGGLLFSLDTDVTVATSSVSFSSGNPSKSPGKAKARATALQIGPESNIEKGKQMAVSTFPQTQYFATVEVAFTGGTRRTVQVVAKTDVESLQKKLQDKAGALPPNSLSELQDGYDSVFEPLTVTALQKPEFDREVGEKADTITLTSNVVTSWYRFKKDDMSRIVTSSTLPDVEPGYELDPGLQIDIKNVEKTKDGSYDILVSVSARAKKTIQVDKVVQSLTFQPTSSLTTWLMQTHGLKFISLDNKSPIPVFGDMILPGLPKQIKVTEILQD